jgi:hypothetical protein
MSFQFNSEEISDSPVFVLTTNSVSSQDVPTDLFYNVADGAERNPDIIRAEMSLLATPINQAYSMDAYVAVKNIQDQCAVDYKNYCSSAPSESMTIDQFFDQIFSPRRLTGKNLVVESAGASLVNSLKSLVGSKKSAAVITKVSHVQNNVSKLKELTGKKSLRRAKRSLAQVDTLASPSSVAPAIARPNRIVKNAVPQEVAVEEVEALPAKPRVSAKMDLTSVHPSQEFLNSRMKAGLSPGPIMKQMDGSAARTNARDEDAQNTVSLRYYIPILC